MSTSKYFFKNINLLNALLITGIILMTHYALFPFLRVTGVVLPPAQKGLIAEKEVVASAHTPPSPSAYDIIAEANLFHPERKIPPEKKEEAPPLPKPDILLYGTLISDDISVAYVEDLKSPVNSPGRGKRQLRMKKGDTLSGFVLKDIETDKIVMVRGEEQMVVSVMDSQKRRTQGTAASAGQALKQALKPQTSPGAASLGEQHPLPKIRAHMTPAEERVRAFFTK